MDKEERVQKANDKVQRFMTLPDGEGVKDFWKCHLKGGIGSGKLFITKNFLIFISSGLVGRTTKVYPMSDLLDLSLAGKTLSVVTHSPAKQSIFEKFDGGEEGLSHCIKTIKRIFYGINGNGVLHTAVIEGDYHKVEQILDYRVQSLEDLNRNGYSALSLACEKNDYKMVETLLKYYRNNLGVVDINQTLPQGDHVLHIACRVSKIADPILKQLLNFDGIDVSAKISYDDTTPLHYFCAYNHSVHCSDIGELFFKHGASPNAKTHHGETPLHKAIFNTTVRVFMVQMLIANGASADIKGGSRGDTPLHYAIRLARPDLVQELLAAGVDMSITNNEGDTVLQTAIKESEIEATPQIKEIIQMLKSVDTLNNLLKSADALELSKHFIRQKMYSNDVLVTLTEASLAQAPFEIKLGQRIKLAQRLEVFKREVVHQEAEAKAQQEAAKAQQQKEEVAALLQGRGEHHVDADNLRQTLQLGVDDKWEIPVDAIEFTAKLGAGASGQVFKGLYKGKEVAIKVLNATDFDDQLEEFKKEFDILRKVNSPYMITFYGAVIERNLSMVMELCERGSLYDVLVKTPKQEWARLLSFARDMAEGISVLHLLEPEPIIHRDLKSLNLLVTRDWRVKVCDFGLSRSVNKGNLETFKKLRGTFAYCAPEVFKGESCTAKSDVFSMGIVIWELMHVGCYAKYQQPYAEFGLHIDFQIIVQTAQGLRPTIPLGCPLDFVEAYAMCISPVPSERATAREVADRIQKAQEDYDRDHKAWLQNAYTEEHKGKYTFESTSNFNNPQSLSQSEKPAGFKGWGSKGAPAPVPDNPVSTASSGGTAFKGWGTKSNATTTTSNDGGDSGKYKSSSTASGDGKASGTGPTRRRDSRAPKPEHSHSSSSGMSGSKKK